MIPIKKSSSHSEDCSNITSSKMKTEVKPVLSTAKKSKICTENKTECDKQDDKSQTLSKVVGGYFLVAKKFVASAANSKHL